jgi:hypothetical protein
MRGRATRDPTDARRAVVALVAIAATGSTPRGSDGLRAAVGVALDTLFSLGLVAVVAGGVLLLYGLTQRKAIAQEVASGRYRRTSLFGWLVFVPIFTAFSYWRIQGWNPPAQQSVEEEPPCGGGPIIPTTPDQKPSVVYEPSVSWIPIAIVVGLVVAAVIAYVVAERRSRSGRGGGHQLAEDLAVVLDETLDDLRAETDPRRAVIAAYARMERVLAANGIARRTAETSDEYLARVLGDLALGSHAIARLTALFTQAKFSQHDIDSTMKEEAIDALEQVRDELRMAEQVRTPAAVDARPIEGSS